MTQAILHLDADAFFASVEQATNPRLKGKPLVTGYERGIATSISYEAKKLGIKRGMLMSQIKKICPDCIVKSSDYETYGFFSQKIFAILRQFSPTVEEYSIDEAFVDLTGLRPLLKSSPEEMAKNIKERVENSLGITVSVGLSLNKSLAKLASNFQKPSGLTIVTRAKINEFLARIPIGNVWGFGPNTTAYLVKLGLKNVLDFVSQDESFVKKNLTKPALEIWQELNGISVYPVNPNPKTTYQSIAKTHTFYPASKDKSFLHREIVKNLSEACYKARHFKLSARKIFVFLKTAGFATKGLEIKLMQRSNQEMEIIPLIRQVLGKIFRQENFYRATGVVLLGLESGKITQDSLFADQPKIAKIKALTKACDKLAGKFGPNTVRLAVSLESASKDKHQAKNLPALGRLNLPSVNIIV